MGLLLQPYRKYFDFRGRARRAEYWLFQLLICIVVFAILTIARVADYEGSLGLRYVAAVAITIFMALSVIPSIAVQFRRLHDIHRSAWWILIGMLPLIGSFVLLIFHLIDGTSGRNRFGPDPKGRGQNDDPEVLVFA